MRQKSSDNPPRACRKCGVVFVPAYKLATNRGRFCTKECYWNAKRLSAEEIITRWVAKSETCWLWTGQRGRGGYGRAHWLDRHYMAHRWMWEMTNGPIPEGLWVCHRCDVRLCVRPDHLFLGTAADNSHDMMLKGRGRQGTFRVRGEASGQTKLVTAQVIALREQYVSGIPMHKLAKIYGVSLSTAHRIIHRMVWAHV